MKILVIGPSWIGDMMISQSLYRTLKVEFPSAEIDVMAAAWSCPLLARMPEVHQAILMPFERGSVAINQRWRLGRAMRKNKYDHAYVLPNSFKSALVPFFANVPRRTGWCGEMRYGLLNNIWILNKVTFPLMAHRYIALAYNKERIHCAEDLPQPLLWPKLLVNEEEITQTTTALNLAGYKPMIGFCQGAEFGPAKHWPYYHYAILAQMLIEQGYHISLFGSEKDYLSGEKIRATLPVKIRDYCINLSGKTHLEQAVILIASCQAIISNDSGLMHIAAALNKPLIALYGPSSPDFTPPLSDKAKVIRLITGYQKVRKGDLDYGYHQSLIDIQPDRVLEALMLLLATSKE